MMFKQVLILLMCVLCLNCKHGGSSHGDDRECKGNYHTVYIGDSHCRNGIEFEGENFGISGLILPNVKSPEDYGCPKVAYFIIGSVDIRRVGGWDYSIPETIANYVEVIDVFEGTGAMVNMIGVFPINKEKATLITGWTDTWMDQYNIDLFDLNEELKGLAERKGIQLFNLWDDFAEDGELITEYTDDGIHVNEDGYDLIYGILYN